MLINSLCGARIGFGEYCPFATIRYLPPVDSPIFHMQECLAHLPDGLPAQSFDG